jgi:hypothetical protein
VTDPHVHSDLPVTLLFASVQEPCILVVGLVCTCLNTKCQALQACRTMPLFVPQRKSQANFSRANHKICMRMDQDQFVKSWTLSKRHAQKLR